MIHCLECRPSCIFYQLTYQEAQRWEGLVKSASFVPGQVIFEQGEPHEGWYSICQGSALVQTRTASGRQLVLYIVRPGEIIGVGEGPYYEVSAQALREVHARYLTRAACERLMQEPSLLTCRLIPLLMNQVRSLRKQCQLMAHRVSVRERLAALLLELGHCYGRGARAQQIELRLSCELLGQMLDSHRSTVNMELIGLQRRRLIERIEGRIVILNEAGLREVAQSVF